MRWTDEVTRHDNGAVNAVRSGRVSESTVGTRVDGVCQEADELPLQVRQATCTADSGMWRLSDEIPERAGGSEDERRGCLRLQEIYSEA